MSEPVIKPPDLVVKDSPPEIRHIHREQHTYTVSHSLLASLVFLVSSVVFLWAMDFFHTHISGVTNNLIQHLITPVVLLLFVVHVALAILMIVKGSTNGLERSLTRFMLAKALFWGWLYFFDPPRPPEQYLALILVVGVTTLDVFIRMLITYVWPVIEVFVPTRISHGYERAVRKFPWSTPWR